MRRSTRGGIGSIVIVAGLAASSVQGGILQYGDQDVLGTGSYGADPTAAATLEGLAVDAITVGGPEVNHGFPFDPEGDDYPGTDQIYVGSNQTAFGDGYSRHAGRLAGPQVVSMDYSSLVPAGQVVESLTLGIAADDFQFPLFGQAFTASINGVTNTALTDHLNSLDQTFPQVQFFSIGIDPGVLTPDHTLVLSIDQLGDGRDGWAIDFLTIGVITVPGAGTGLALAGGLGLAGARRRA